MPNFDTPREFGNIETRKIISWFIWDFVIFLSHSLCEILEVSMCATEGKGELFLYKIFI